MPIPEVTIHWIEIGVLSFAGECDTDEPVEEVNPEAELCKHKQTFSPPRLGQKRPISGPRLGNSRPSSSRHQRGRKKS